MENNSLRTAVAATDNYRSNLALSQQHYHCGSSISTAAASFAFLQQHLGLSGSRALWLACSRVIGPAGFRAFGLSGARAFEPSGSRALGLLGSRALGLLARLALVLSGSRASRPPLGPLAYQPRGTDTHDRRSPVGSHILQASIRKP
jgi:hypothetical protein